MGDIVKIATRESYGNALAELGKVNPNVVVLDADLAGATKTSTFKKAFPDRHIDCGIAEANMTGIAAGLSTCGKIPFVSSFAMFAAGRNFEQVRNSIGYPHLNVKIGATHAGITVGEDGASHQCLEDIALMRTIPGMTVIVPSDDIEAKACVRAAIEYEGPVYIRTARLATPVYDPRPFTVGKGNVIRDGSDCAIFTCGIMLEHAIEAADILAGQGVNAALVSFHTIKPFDEELALRYTAKCRKVFTVEEHSVIGGLGDTVASAIIGNGVEKFMKIGINDVFGQSGKPADLLKEYELTGPQIAEKILKNL